MASHRPVKSVKKSSVPGVTIQQFVDNIPTGCCTPDFERKPITLTLQEGKNAIFRAVVKGVPVPEVVWKRNKGEMDNPDKYQTSFNAVTNEFILQINKLTAADADLYRCSVVNEYGEAFCVVGLRIIQAGFKKKMRQVPTETQQDLKKEIQDFKKLLRKRVPQAARKKDIDMEQVWQLLLHADKKDYEKICLRYGIVDFRGMLRKLQQMKKDKEDKQAKYINSIRNLRHIKVNKEGNAMFDLEMDLKDPQSRIYLYKDGEMINYGFNDDNMKHCLKQVGKTYRFIINDLKSEDAGVYQLKVEDVDVFSTELEVDTIPVTFEHPLSEVCCSEQENAVFECSLCSPCYDAMWLHANNPIENNNKYEISVSSDGLNHKLMIKSVQPADKGTYTLDTGICSSSACLLVEPARGKRRQAEGDETDKKGQQMDRLSDKESVKKLRQGEGPGDKDHFRDTAIGKDGLYGSGLDDNKGLYSSSMGADGRHGYLGQDGLAAGGRVGKMGTGQISTAGIDGNLMENANKFGRFPGDEGGCMRQIYDQESKLGGKLFNEVTDGRKSGVPDEGWQGYEPMSGLHSGAFSGDRRRQMYGLDASGLSADENLGSRDRKGREGRFPQDDVREPRCHFNKRLSDVHALKRKPAELCCSLNNEQMEGSWFKDGFKLTGMDGVSFEKEGPNHRLIIDEVDDIHAGTYRFEAEGIKTEAKIFVEDPPNVDKDLQEKLMKDPLVIKAGQNAVVKIPFEGRKPVKATWLKDGCELLDDTRIHTDKADNFTRLSISSANRKDCGDYKVKLSNGSGALEVNLKLVVTDRPQSPMGPIEVVDSSITGITIQWKPPKDDGGKPVLSYAIERQQVGRQTWLTVGEADGSSTTFTTNKVEHDKSYCFRVRAINAEGSSEPLESGEVMAATKVFPGPPAPPKIVEASKEAIKLSWAVPDKTGNSRILGYIVEKRKKGSSTWAPVTDQPITERKWKVTDLKEGLQYEFRVAAVNAAGTGEASAPSESVFAQDPMDPPGHVRDLKVTNTDYTSITLAWTKPKPEDGGEAKGYMVEMRSSNNLKWTQCNTQPLRMTMYTVKGLEPKEMYFLRVRAVNDGGAGEAVALDTDIQAMPPMVTPKFLIDDTVKSFMIVKAGNFIRVHIPFEASPAPEVTWLKDGLSLPRKAITTTKQGHTQLVIPAAEFSDSGIYSILLQNELGKRDLFSFQIQVTAEFKVRLPKYRGVNQNQPPRFLVQLKPHVVTTGFDCRMSCAVTGHPKPKVTWYKDGKNLSEDPTFFSKNDFGVCCLVILGVTTKDEGAYEVLATNELGCAISKTFLVVREPSF
ncbi:immunoglobulin-like and fibronectin type III domain-containing protein 1 isoform A [Alligator mississippiensis]|nr:immunoglobulin-like and fibronectin type III domain-containing protein 1 isoform A [Alligator mississippiensis]